MAVVLGPTIWQLNQNHPLGGEALLGGTVICKNGGIIWIVAPKTSEVSRTWYCRDDAVTLANACSGVPQSLTSSQWFVPTCGQLKNPAYTCKTLWDPAGSCFYWSSTEHNSVHAVVSRMSDGCTITGSKSSSCCVRAFRCVTY